eukprot:gene9663-1870_t
MLKRTDYQVLPPKRMDSIEIPSPLRIEEPTNFCCYPCFIFSNWLYKHSSTPKTPSEVNLNSNSNIFNLNKNDLPPPPAETTNLMNYETESEPKSFWCFCCFHFSRLFKPETNQTLINHETITEHQVKADLPIIKIVTPTTEKVRKEMNMINLDIPDEQLLCTDYTQTPLSPSSFSPFDDRISSYNSSPRSEEIDHPDIIDMLKRHK